MTTHLPLASLPDAEDAAVDTGVEETRWIAWLRAHADPGWRVGQWDGAAWLFTGVPGDPTTTVKYCAVAACDFVIAHGRVCGHCLRALRASTLPYEDFIASHQPQRSKQRAHTLGQGEQQCTAHVRQQKCPRTQFSQDLCLYHYNKFAKLRRAAGAELDVATWIATGDFAIPEPDHRPPCLVVGCDRSSTGRKPGVCHLHYGRYRSTKASDPIEVWARHQVPCVIDNQFTLVHVTPRLRWELLYAIQQRDAAQTRLDISAVRSVTRFLRYEPSLATATDTELERLLARTPGNLNVHSHLVDYFRSLRNGYDEMLGRSPQERTVWDLVDVGLSPEPVYRGARKRKGIDFGEIEQPWLRKVLMDWAADQSDAPTVRECFRATRLASIALGRCGARGADPSALTFADATRVAEGIADATMPRGKPGSPKYRRDLYNIFFGLITHARRQQTIDISAQFVPDRQHLALYAAPPAEEDGSGKAIPTLIQRQLDANLATIGDGFQHGTLSSELTHLMFRTAYIVLRDTGRRPLEVVSLKRNCLRRDANGSPILVYDNHKAGRMNRQLPIVASTAEAIEEWDTTHRPQEPTDDSYLFPGALARHRHLLTYHLSTVLRSWVDNLDRLDTNEVDATGSPLPFDRKRIYPYAFRHSYAQRHADNGVAVDVLRDLLDHRSMSTTTGYYTITADRKREAVEVVGQYATDRTGSSAPIAVNSRYQVGSVAVPFGNCIEPSNVKAGGHACPIRFQCAGCGFYRPDPSFLPAIEEHLVALKADRETAQALGSAAFVVDNLSAQIAAFQQVISVMRANLDQLDPADKQRVEAASATLRKARAGIALPLTVLDHHPGSGEPPR